MNEQKAALLAKGWSEQELADNQWRPKLWTSADDAQHERAMDPSVRDYLRCPTCKAIGTYKPRQNDEYEHPRYWVCKWCGYGRNFDGEWQYYPDGRNNCWGIKTADSTPTPRELVGKLDPWCG